MTTESLLALLQFTDGLFPAGGHAHSFGLETYVQDERIRDASDVRGFLEALLEGSAGPCDAVAAVGAARAGRTADLGALLALDARLEAQKVAEELRLASRQMGRQTLRVAAELIDHATVGAFDAEVEGGRTPGHNAVVFGLLAQATGAADEVLAAAYLHQTAVVVVGASLRLITLGQMDGQRILRSVQPVLARLAQEAARARRPLDEMWSFNPGIDVASMRHAGLDARLFRS
jgi:urease accessory protein